MSGENKAGKAREFITFLDRRDRIPELISTLRKERPDINNALEKMDV
jgi:hypothetical protein